MNYILGAALMIASITVLHLARWAVNKPGMSARVHTLIAEAGGTGFAALFAGGLILTVRELMIHLDPIHGAAVAASLAAAYVGSKRLGRYLHRLEARRHTRLAVPIAN